MSAKLALILPSAALIDGQAYDAILEPDGAGCVIVQPRGFGLMHIQIDIPLDELEKIVAVMKHHQPPRVEGW